MYLPIIGTVIVIIEKKLMLIISCYFMLILISFGSSGRVKGFFKPQFERSKQQMVKEIICFILIFEI